MKPPFPQDKKPISKTFVTSISGFGDDEEELITALAFEFGCAGISEDLPFTQESLEWEPKFKENQPRQIQLFFDSFPDDDLVRELKSRAHWDVEIKEIIHKDWLSEWKKGYSSFEIVEGVWIVPSWLEPPSEAKKIIKIDPGMAFGTGTHETTQLAAAHIARLLKDQYLKRGSVPNKAADIGSGTGVLAMLMKHFGVEHVLALDIDVECVKVCLENVQNNQMDIRSEFGSVDSLKECLPMIVANIVDGVLIRLAPEFVQKLRVGGFLILSGILDENQNEVKNVFEDLGLQLREKTSKAEWVGMTFEKILA